MRYLLIYLFLIVLHSGFGQDGEKEIGLDIHGGSFGLFNVNDEFTKAEYTFGASLYGDYSLHKNFAVGIEQMILWGKPKNQDGNRTILNTNARFKLKFQTFEKVHFNVLIAGGFSLWPANTQTAYLTPTFNDTRLGWDFRAAAGADFRFSDHFSLMAQFGYQASSSTSDDIIWITHDSMLISVGPKIRF